MEKLKQFPAAQKRLVCILLALICMLGLLPSTAFAAGPNTIVMEDCTHNGVYYESAALSTCWLHQMKFDFNGDTVMGFCADHGGGMGWSLEGHEWNNPREITDPTVKTMMAYFYAHSRGIFTDQAKALGVDETWSSDYTWTMNAWVQAVVWRYQENLFSDPVAACAEELMYVYNNLEHTSYSSIDDVVDGTTLRDRAQYILDLGAQGVWGDCTVYEYDYAGPGTAQHPAYDVQGIIIGDLTVTRERYQFTIKKVDATNPNKALPGARFLVQNANGTFSQEVVTGSDGTVTLTNLEASTYSVTELDPPDNYQIDNAGPQYVVLPSATGETTATVTFTDTPIRTGEGSIRKVDADDPTKGLAGAVIKIEGVDNEFTGTYITGAGGCTYITGAGGYLEDVPWDAMPIGSFVASEVTPPNGYTTSSDPDKVRQEFYWDGKHDVDLIFENDAKVKVQLIKLDDSDNPIEGAVFNVVKDGQVIATEATDADGSIIVPNVTEGMYAFFEVSVPAPYAKLQQPVIAHVDQATVDGGGTVTVTAVDQMLPTLTILKRDGQTGEVVPGAVFEVKGIHHGYHTDVTTGPDGTAALTGLPVDSYEVTEISVPDPYVVAAEPTQTIWLGPGDNRQLIFDTPYPHGAGIGAAERPVSICHGGLQRSGGTRCALLYRERGQPRWRSLILGGLCPGLSAGWSERPWFGSAFAFSAEVEKLALLARVLPAYTGHPKAAELTEQMLLDTVPIEMGYAKRGWFLLKIPALLPKKGTGSPIYIQQYLYPALRRYFDGKPPALYHSCVLAYRHVYQHDRPERAYRDHDNIEVNMVTDIVTLYLMPDDAPRRCAHYYCSAAGEVDCTEVYVVPASRFPEWLAAAQADDLKEEMLYETSEIWD